jgi:Zn-finger nucleic acid-binding protein
MICPVCRKGALIIEYNHIELDYCPVCQGVWFDSGELELLLESAGLGDHRRYMEEMVSAPEAKTSEKKRKCPICHSKMKKTYIDEDKKILIDACRVGHGIWFDGGEIQSLVKELEKKSPAKGTAKSVLEFVGKMFKYRKE